MRKMVLAVVCLVLFPALPCLSQAAPLNTFVGQFAVAGATNRDELKTALQGILSSRLNPETATLVESAEKAEVVVSGAFTQFGKTFTLDVLLKDRRSLAIKQAFEQGEAIEDIIPALGRLSSKLDRALREFQGLKVSVGASLASTAEAEAVGLTALRRPLPAAKSLAQADGETDAVWTSAPLEGEFTGIAAGRTLAAGDREIFLASDHSIQYFRKGAELKKVAEIAIPLPSRILAIDTADLDHDGVPELYVTVIDRDRLLSRVYLPSETGLTEIAGELPWFFRAIGGGWKSRSVYAQKRNGKGAFAGDVFALEKRGSRFEPGKSLKLGSGNIFGFTPFADKKGAVKTVVFDEDRRLCVRNSAGKELWKSGEKYGGSESYFFQASDLPVRNMGEEVKRQFLEQRVMALPNAMLLVPRNDGGLTVGDSRSYANYSLHVLKWTGAVLKEAWHGAQVPAYLADYDYDPETREAVLLEVVQKSGVAGKGKSAISINTIQ